MSDLHYLKLSWKPFKVHMPAAEAYFRGACGYSYVGNSATESELTLWFSEKPSEQVELLALSFWDSLSEKAESAKIEHAKKLAKAEALARENIINVDFPDMIVAEKKIFMNRPLTDEDREALLAKYPTE